MLWKNIQQPIFGSSFVHSIKVSKHSSIFNWMKSMVQCWNCNRSNNKTQITLPLQLKIRFLANNDFQSRQDILSGKKWNFKHIFECILLIFFSLDGWSTQVAQAICLRINAFHHQLDLQVRKTPIERTTIQSMKWMTIEFNQFQVVF